MDSLKPFENSFDEKQLFSGSNNNFRCDVIKSWMRTNLTRTAWNKVKKKQLRTNIAFASLVLILTLLYGRKFHSRNQMFSGWIRLFWIRNCQKHCLSANKTILHCESLTTKAKINPSPRWHQVITISFPRSNNNNYNKLAIWMAAQTHGLSIYGRS